MQEKMTQKEFLTQKWHFEEEKTWKIPILSQYTTLYSIWRDKTDTFQEKITTNIIILHFLDRCTVRFFTQSYFMKRRPIISNLYDVAQQLKTIYKINKTMFLRKKVTMRPVNDNKTLWNNAINSHSIPMFYNGICSFSIK